MTLAEAMFEADQEYSAEVLRARQDKALDALMSATILTEYAELDEQLPSYVAHILSSMGWEPGLLDPRLYQLATMCFRAGMRVQRKLYHPDQPTTVFWRSDQKVV